MLPYTTKSNHDHYKTIKHEHPLIGLGVPILTGVVLAVSRARSLYDVATGSETVLRPVRVRAWRPVCAGGQDVTSLTVGEHKTGNG